MDANWNHHCHIGDEERHGSHCGDNDGLDVSIYTSDEEVEDVYIEAMTRSYLQLNRANNNNDENHDSSPEVDSEGPITPSPNPVNPASTPPTEMVTEKVMEDKPRTLPRLPRLAIDQCDVSGKRVLVRLDLDVPIRGGALNDTSRLMEGLRTVRYVLLHGAKSVVLIGHRGQPGGKEVPDLSLEPVARELQNLLFRPVTFLDEPLGPGVVHKCADPDPGSVFLLENLRFYKEEEGRGVSEQELRTYREWLSELGDVYVNDNMAGLDSRNSSVVGVAMPRRAMGFRLQKEVEIFSKICESPARPVVAIVGGHRVEDRLELMDNLLDVVDEMIVGGDMAFTFLKIVKSLDIGDSPFDAEGARHIPALMAKAQLCHVTVHLPSDFAVSSHISAVTSFTSSSSSRSPLQRSSTALKKNAVAKKPSLFTADLDGGIDLPEGMMGADIGDKTREAFVQVLAGAGTVLWEGAIGAFKRRAFADGTKAVVEAVAQATSEGATSVIVGEDTVTCVRKFAHDNKFTLLSAGGEAGLQLMAGNSPGLEVLSLAPRPKGELNKLTMAQCPLRGQRVVILADFDVPVKNGEITDNQKIVAALPTIEYVLQQEAHSVVLMSHLGCPDGQPNMQYSLKPVADELEKLLERNVVFVNNCVGPEAEEICSNTWPGTLFLLENLRFHVEEEGVGVGENGQEIRAAPEDVKAFSDSLSMLGNVFINDAFGASHGACASTMGEQFQYKAAGLLMEKQLDVFEKVLHNPGRPLLAIMGGRASFSDRVPLMENLMDMVDEMIICGEMALTFLKVLKSMDIGSSAFDQAGVDLVPALMERARLNRVHIHLPEDFVTGNKMANDADTETADVTSGIPPGWIGLDIGEQSQATFADVIARVDTVVWIGPPGVCEMEPFSKGTQAMMEEVSRVIERGALTMICGWDPAMCCSKFNTEVKVGQVIIRGGASLQLLEGRQPPGIAALSPSPVYTQPVSGTKKKGKKEKTAATKKRKAAKRKAKDTVKRKGTGKAKVKEKVSPAVQPQIDKPEEDGEHEAKGEGKHEEDGEHVTKGGEQDQGPEQVAPSTEGQDEKQEGNAQRHEVHARIKKHYKTTLPPLPTYEPPRPRIKYEGAPPPGKNLPFPSALFRPKPWTPPPPLPPPPKKPGVPRFSRGPPRPPVSPPPVGAEMPYSFKHKIGESGRPGPTYRVHHYPTVPSIPHEPPKPKNPRVPRQLGALARLDSQGNISVHIKGDSDQLPPDPFIQVTLVHGYSPMPKEHEILREVELFDPTVNHKIRPRLVDLPAGYSPLAPSDEPGPGKLPKLNTTFTAEQFMRYRSLFPLRGQH